MVWKLAKQSDNAACVVFGEKRSRAGNAKEGRLDLGQRQRGKTSGGKGRRRQRR